MLTTSLAIFFFLFGVLLGTLFGFFAMGGSFLITPLLMILGFPTSEAVATGLAFVFGTSIISILKHREYGQSDYKLGIILGVSMSIGVYFGSQILAYFERIGNTEQFVGVAYIVLLFFVGWRMIVTSKTDSTPYDEYEKLIKKYRFYPIIRVGRKERKVSLWFLVLIGGVIGILAGIMGVGGGFLLVPAATMLLGLNPAIAVGTAILVVALSTGYGTFLYSGRNLVDLGVVSILLFGSALGAKLGAKASHIAPEQDLEFYFGLMMLLGGIAIFIDQLSNYLVFNWLNYLSVFVMVGVAFSMSLIIYKDAFHEWLITNSKHNKRSRAL